MIRINLLRNKRSRRVDASHRQLLFMAAGVLGALATIIVVHVQASSALDELQTHNSRVKSDIDRLKAELGDYDKVKAQREELLKQRKSIAALELGRTGPVFLLRELSEILTPGKGPTFDGVAYQENLLRDPNAGFNASWDTHRVWLEGFDEIAKKVKIKGAAKSNEDVAEFLKRLNLSVFFADVTPEQTSQITVGAAGSTVKYVNFTLSASVIY